MIFTRTLRQEFTHSAAGIFVSLFAILLSMQAIRLLNEAAGGRLSPEAVLALLGFAALKYLPILLSLTIFVAILLSLSRAWRDSEMVVWFSAGMPLYAWAKPVLQFVLPVVLLVGFLSLYLSPWALSQSVQYRTRLDARQDASLVTPGIFREIQKGQDNNVIFVEHVVGQEQHFFRNIFVSSQQNGVDGIVLAERARQETHSNGDVFIVLENGRRYELEPGKAEYNMMQFERYAVRARAKAPPPEEVEARTMPLRELWADRSQGARAEILWRLGLPISTLCLGLLAIPLSFVNPRGGRSTNLAIAIFVYSIYYNMLSIFKTQVERGRLDFEPSWWLPHALALALFALLLYQRLAPDPLWRRLFSQPGLRDTPPPSSGT